MQQQNPRIMEKAALKTGYSIWFRDNEVWGNMKYWVSFLRKDSSELLSPIEESICLKLTPY